MRQATEQPLPAERVALPQALGRCLAEDLHAQEDQPPFAASAMDGYAVPWPGSTELRVVREIAAGGTPGARLEAGTCARIFTGGPVPPGAGAVVPQEVTERSGDTVRLSEPPESGQHVRPAGEHCRAGERLLEAGTRLTPARLGLAALLGFADLSVRRLPRVTLLGSGDELVEPGQPLGPSQIRNSNAYALQAQVTACGGSARRHPNLPDDPAAIATALSQAAQESDLVIACGGISVGERDYMRAALELLGGELVFWRVAIQPGKPVALARLGGCPVLLLPGNPVSCFVTFELFARPLLDRLAGGAGRGLSPRRCRLGSAVRRKPGLRQFLRCSIDEEDAATAFPAQGSHLFRGVAESHGLLVVPEGEGGLEPGAPVDVLLWPLS